MAMDKDVVIDFCNKAGGRLSNRADSVVCELPDGTVVGYISSRQDLAAPFEVKLPDRSGVEIMTSAMTPECTVEEQDNHALGKIVKLVCFEPFSDFYEYKLEVEHITGNKSTTVHEQIRLDVGDSWRPFGLPRTPVIQTNIK